MRNNWNLWAFLFVLVACEPKQSSMSYEDFVAKHRKEANKFMNTDEESPFLDADSIIQLNYYPADESFKVIATIERIKDGSQMTLGTSDSKPRVYHKYAFLNFELKGQPLQLLVLKGVDSEGLFLGFADLTNDDTTYGGGRYVNLNFSDQANKITLDFNMAYNPYCEYNSEYSCPLPPLDNYLKIAIPVGEKLYK